MNPDPSNHPQDAEVHRLADALESLTYLQLNGILFHLRDIDHDNTGAQLLQRAACEARKRFEYSDEEMGVDAFRPWALLPFIRQNDE